MLYLFLVAGLFLLPILLRLAIRLRLGIPILYALGMLTVFHSWYQTHTALADGIFFVLVGLAALSWVFLPQPLDPRDLLGGKVKPETVRIVL